MKGTSYQSKNSSEILNSDYNTLDKEVEKAMLSDKEKAIKDESREIEKEINDINELLAIIDSIEKDLR